MLPVVTPSAADAASPPETRVWFYRLLDKPQWCAVFRNQDAATAANSGAFDGSESAMLRVRGNTFSVLVASRSEDAFVEDRYTFGPSLKLTGVARRGQYVQGSSLNVSFVPDRDGRLQLTSRSRTTMRKSSKAGHETYFLDWPLYQRFADMPFASLVPFKPALGVADQCPVHPSDPRP